MFSWREWGISLPMTSVNQGVARPYRSIKAQKVIKLSFSKYLLPKNFSFQIWNHYDADKKGYLERQQLRVSLHLC